MSKGDSSIILKGYQIEETLTTEEEISHVICIPWCCSWFGGPRRVRCRGVWSLQKIELAIVSTHKDVALTGRGVVGEGLGISVGSGLIVGFIVGSSSMLHPATSFQQKSPGGHSSLSPDGQCRSRVHFLASKTSSPQKLRFPGPTHCCFSSNSAFSVGSVAFSLASQGLRISTNIEDQIRFLGDYPMRIVFHS